MSAKIETIHRLPLDLISKYFGQEELKKELKIKDGLDGKIGPKGKDGKDGLDGVGIQDISFEESKITISLTDGSEFSHELPKGTKTSVVRSKVNALAGLKKIQNTSSSENIRVINDLVIRQVEKDITTTLVGPAVGTNVYIKNRSDGCNTLILTLDGVVNPEIASGESYYICFNGEDWDIL